MRSTPLVLVALLATAVRAEPDDPKALLAAGLAHERAGEWIEARHVYEKLALAKGFSDQALYLQAWSALQAGDDDAAMKLAGKTIEGGGAFQSQARFVYGDALYHRGEFTRAKHFFTELRDRSTGDARLVAAAKLAACEHMIDPTAVVAPATTPTPAPASAPAVADTPKALLEAGAALDKAGKWTEAAAIYMRLEKHKGYENEALYRQAWDAFQTNDISSAQMLAERAVKTVGPHQRDAKVLYADAIFRGGDYTRAKSVYVGILANVTGDLRVAITKKIVVCNTKLNLPDHDGVPAP